MKILIKKSTTASFETIEINDTPLGKGGQGAVHNITTSQYSADYCIKIYIREAEKMQKKIEYMVTHPPQNIRATSFRICWPTALAYNTNKEFIGYMMPLAFPKGHDLTILSVYRNKPLSQIKRYKNKVEWHDKYELDTTTGIINRVKMLCNIAIALHSIHSTGRYVLVDLKPENIDATGTGKVSIMDTDSIQISENGRILHPATAFTPDYFAPEGKDIKKCNRPFPLQCDYFAAAICFYQILTGTHPYAGTVLHSPYDNCTELSDCIANGLFAFGEKQRYISLPKGFNLQQNFHNLPPTVQELFKRAFGSKSSDRPSMEEWGRTFHEIITGGIKVGPSTITRDSSNLPFKITKVTFADEDYDGNTIRGAGSKLYNNTTYLCPIISYTVLNIVGNIEIQYKIIDPRGGLVTNANTKGTLPLTSKGLYTKGIGGWGNKNKTAYKIPGEYHIEFYYNGKCIHKTSFTIHDIGSSTAPSLPFTITGVSFSDHQYDGTVIRSVGSKLYTDVTYLCPTVSYTVNNPIGNVDLHYKITAPNGTVLSNSNTKGSLPLSTVGQTTKRITGWGNTDKTLYNRAGEYTIDFYYNGKYIYRTSVTIHPLSSSKPTSTTTNRPKRQSTGPWSKLNNAIASIGDWFEDHHESIADPSIWTIIFGIIGAIGIIAGAISTGSVFWGIVVGVIGFGIGTYVVVWGGVIIGLIVGLILKALRYLFYNIYSILIVIAIVLGIVFAPEISDVIDRLSGGKSYTPTTVVNSAPTTTTYYCTAKDNLNIRKEPYSNAQVLGVLKPGQSVQVYTINGDWATIKYNNSKAYVSSKFISRNRP